MDNDNRESVQRDLDETRRQIDEMRNSPDNADRGEDLNRLEERRSRLENEVRGLPDDDQSAWERIKNGVRNSIDEIKSEINQFRNK